MKLFWPRQATESYCALLLTVEWTSCSIPDTSEEATISAIMPDDKKKKVLNTREIREWKPSLSSSSSGRQSKRGLNLDWPAHTVGQFTLCCIVSPPWATVFGSSISNWCAVMGGYRTFRMCVLVSRRLVRAAPSAYLSSLLPDVPDVRDPSSPALSRGCNCPRGHTFPPPPTTILQPLKQLAPTNLSSLKSFCWVCCLQLEEKQPIADYSKE